VSIRGFVQAGGRSTRFGTDKALVRLAGKTMLQRTGELLETVCGHVTIVAPAGKYADAPWPVLRDRWPGEGPLGGILTALLHRNDVLPSRGSRVTDHESRCLILSCDMPFLTREFLECLCERASSSRAFVVVPQQSTSGLEPLCACWNSEAAASVLAAFDAGVRKVTEAMKRLPMEVLDESAWKRFDTENRLFWNMNTPADYEKARRILEAPEQ
jgi:molybdopterin-guanine dinucleotide biosynthesis protein A